MAELTKATFDGSTVTLGQEQQIPQGQFKTQVMANRKVAKIYQNNTTLNTFIAVLPGRYWVELPSSITTRNTTQIKSYTTSLLNAPEPVVETPNVNDSYSLRDITEFNQNVAIVTISGGYEWVDENSVKLSTNTVFQFNPRPGWAATFTADDETLTVLPNQNFTTMGRSGDENIVTMDAIQYVAQDGTFEVWTGDFKTSSSERPIAYYGAFQQGDRRVIEEFSNSIGTAQLVQMPNNAVTGVEGEYLVFVSRGGGESTRIGMFNTETEQFVPFDGLEDATDFYNEYVEGLMSSEKLEQEQAAAQAAADVEAAKVGKVIGTESRNSRTYEIKYLSEGKYGITNNDGLLIATYEAESDSEALTMAPAKIEDYESTLTIKEKPDNAWAVTFVSLLGLAVVIGLIMYVRVGNPYDGE